MATPPLPPGFVYEDEAPKKRTVQFDWEGYVPPEVKAAAEQASANLDTAEPAIPHGFEEFSPGVGRSVPDPLSDARKQREMMGAGIADRIDPTAAFASGALSGARGTGLGIAQFGAHVNVPQRVIGAGLEAAGIPTPMQGIDQQVADYQSWRASDPAMQTMAGKGGEFFGGMAATAPLAAVSVPAKGAGVLSMFGRGALGGAMVADSQPVDGNNFAAEKGLQTAYGAGLGGAVPVGLRGLMAFGERMFPPNAMAQLSNFGTQGANKKPFAQEGEDLAQRTGVRMTPGQVSGSKVGTALENMSRQSIFSADKAFEADTRIAHDAIRYMDRVMDGVTKNPASEAVLGSQIQSTVRGAVEKIATQRETVAAQQYGAIDKMLGNRAFVKPTNAMREADALIKEYSGIVTPEAQRIVAQAKALKDKLAQKQGFTFREAQANRGYYGKGARGGTNVFDDVSGDLNRTIATRLFKAFDADMEQSAAGLSGKGPGMVPHGTVGLDEAIRQANGNYRRYSQLMDYTKAHPIARLLGDDIKLDDVVQFNKIAPETVIQRMGNMKPTELHMVRDFMKQNAPEAWQQYKRLLIEKAMDSARTLPTSAGANVVPFNASRFVRELGGDNTAKIKQLNAIFDASELRELDDAFAVARRLGDRFGYNGSGTGPYQEAAKFFDAIKGRAYQAVASSGGEALGLRRIANVMLNADGRRALIQLSKLPPQSRQAASLVGFLASLAAGQQAIQPDKSNRQY